MLTLLSRNVLVLTAVLTLCSCGGGSITAGLGGSGIGGTGITTVSGNVTQVVSQAPELRDRTLTYKLFAAMSKLLGDVANAQTGSPAGIKVSGGGKSAITDGLGRFELEKVTPSDNFVLLFAPPNGQSASLPIGAVPAGSHVRVNNIVLNTNQGSASADKVEVEESSDSDDGVSNGNENSPKVGNDEEGDEDLGGDDGDSAEKEGQENGDNENGTGGEEGDEGEEGDGESTES